MDQFIQERSKWAAYYSDQLKDLDWLRTPSFGSDYHHGWQSYVTFVDESKAPASRNQIMELLQERGISTRPGTHAVHMLNFYKEKYQIQPSDFPGAQAANDFSMAIPLHNRMSEEDFNYVVQVLKEL
ncbi:DegT/DnrJ/EryC1/StrS family aminotransferase [Algoriphagus boritolerans]|uniref:DegT/DnrJ/EryC1/StrS family aminotransferase n=1 Tax=Algoriphagus boritolerans TaxID=308111 RepID=UPI000AECD9D6